MKTCIIWRGHPGSGKSTIDKRFCEAFETHFLNKAAKELVKEITGGAPASFGMSIAVSCCTDDFWDLPGNRGKFDTDRAQEAHDWNWNRFSKALDLGIPLVTLPNVNYARQHWEEYEAYARSKDYTVFVLEVCCDPDVAFARSEHGPFPEGLQERFVNRWDTPSTTHKDKLEAIGLVMKAYHADANEGEKELSGSFALGQILEILEN